MKKELLKKLLSTLVDDLTEVEDDAEALQDFTEKCYIALTAYSIAAFDTADSTETEITDFVNDCVMNAVIEQNCVIRIED